MASAHQVRQAGLLVLCGGLVIGMSMGARNVQGLFMLPMLGDKGWAREAFSFAMGLQMLAWGAMQPVAGWLSDRFGSGRVIAVGCSVYALGLVVESLAPSPYWLSVGAGLLVGAGLSATTFGAVYGGLSRLIAPERRGWAQGVAGGIGGLVQFILVPIAQLGIDSMGWSAGLQVLAALALACGLCGFILEPNVPLSAATGSTRAAAWPVIRAALGHPGFWLLNLGFVSCGFQLAFLGVHLPAYLKDMGLDASASVRAVAIIALANAAGTYVFGRLGDLYRRKYLLSGLYAVRTSAVAIFVLLPVSTTTLYGFALVMGFTWLGTVPLTNGIVAQIFGVRYIGTLFGLVFVGHQLGGFFGSWLGGALYDATHSYNVMWMLCVALGVASVALNLPISDRSVEHRLAPAAG